MTTSDISASSRREAFLDEDRQTHARRGRHHRDNLARLATLTDHKISRRQIGDPRAVPIGHRDVDAAFGRLRRAHGNEPWRDPKEERAADRREDIQAHGSDSSGGRHTRTGSFCG
jgi:hypothetical protein